MDQVNCDECGNTFNKDSLIEISNLTVCQDCKSNVLQRLRENVEGFESDDISAEINTEKNKLRSVAQLVAITWLVLIIIFGTIILAEGQMIPSIAILLFSMVIPAFVYIIYIHYK